MVNNNWLKILVAISAIMIAGSAAYFSVTGLGVLFSGAAIAVMVMAGSLEFAKLVTATYLKQEWDSIKGLNKWYLTFSVVILMAITSAGIFGYLSNAFQQQNLKLNQVQREIDVWNNKIKLTNDQIVTLQGQQKDLASTQNTLLAKGNVNSRLLRSADNRDRQSNKISNKINSLQDSIVTYNGKINDIKNNNIDIEREVGGFRFVAEAFNVELNTVVKFFIILIVIVFDPLAVALVISFNQLVMIKRKDEEIESTTEPTSNPEDLKNFVDEAVRVRISDEDLKKLEEALLNPPAPNEELKDAAEKYKEKVLTDDEILKRAENIRMKKVFERMEEIEKIRESIHGPILPEDEPVGALANSEYREKENLYDMTDDELSDYWLSQQKESKDWDEIDEEQYEDPTIEEEFSTIEPTEEEESENFSTVEPILENNIQNDEEFTIPVDGEIEPELTFSDEFISEAIDEFNKESIEDEPTYQSDTKEIDQMLEIVNNVIDEDLNEEPTSPEQDDEKKN